jgi:hypothetical protein
MKRFYGNHLEENQTELLLEILNKYELTDFFGYFVSDNAASNDVYIDSYFRIVLSNLPISKRSQRRLRCYNHILNLAANAYLWGKDSFSFDQEFIINNILQLE